ncbi:helix-turn-helix domain-containing protein [Mycobacteroides stephanolepidis]|uniref:helix-turn-helix domain-containing protein n=1 Tax=[Mycobacterium] stephanolepidis TaxID=1520670 RepID=UPI001E2DF782|nr:helix-turn-helix transcriptional regulator [[Mycobacterium] stephanolepidis]
MALVDDPVRVGATVRALRESNGWALGKFSSVIGMSHGHLANIEAGRKRCTPEMARKIADVLGVPLAAITTGIAPEVIAG